MHVTSISKSIIQYGQLELFDIVDWSFYILLIYSDNM